MADMLDKFGRPSAAGQYASPTTVTVDRTIGDLSVLNCFDLSGVSETPHVYFVTYKKTVDPATNRFIVSNKTSWKGLANVSNNTITNLRVSPGYTDLGNTIGDFVEFMPTSEWGGDLIDGLTETLNLDGALKDGIVTNAKIANNAVTTAKIADEAVTSSKIDFATLYTTATNNYVATNQTTASTSYVSLSTAQSITVTVGATGKMVVGITVSDAGNNTQNNQSRVSFELSGANTLAAGTAGRMAFYQSYVNNAAGSIAGTYFLTGLNPGSTTVTMRFSVGGGTGSFAGRNIWALPL